MFARISWGKIKSGTWDEFEAALVDAVTGVKPQKGFKGRLLLRDVNDPNAGYTLSLWETEEDMRNYEASDTVQKRVLPAVERFFTGEYTTTFVEVRHGKLEV